MKPPEQSQTEKYNQIRSIIKQGFCTDFYQIYVSNKSKNPISSSSFLFCSHSLRAPRINAPNSFLCVELREKINDGPVKRVASRVKGP